MVDAWLASVPLTGLSVENLQVRVRGTTLMALSNEHGHPRPHDGQQERGRNRVLQAVRRQRRRVRPRQDVPKSLVWALARWRNRVAAERGEVPPIPENSIEKPPSDELAPGQLDSDRLPPYDVLDPVLDAPTPSGTGDGPSCWRTASTSIPSTA